MNHEEKERKLIKLLKAYPHPDHTEEDRKGVILAIMISADENGWTDEFIRICEANPDVTFSELTQLIFTEERFPPLEVVDEEEDNRSFYDTRERSEYVVAVDFDGTLCKSKYPECGEPILKNVQRVRELKRDGATIILWTCREGEALTKAVKWCEEHNVPIDYVNVNAPSRIARYGSDCRKISADLYIDDKAD